MHNHVLLILVLMYIDILVLIYYNLIKKTEKEGVIYGKRKS